MTEAPQPITIQPVKPVAQSRWRRWSARQWRRLLSAMLLLFVFLCIMGPIVLVALFGFNNPPTWIADAYEYKVTNRLAFSASILLMAIIGVTWLLGVIGSIAGALVLGGGGTRSLRSRLRISRQRLAVVTAVAVWLRVALLGALLIAGLLTYTHFLGPQVNTGLPEIDANRLRAYVVSLLLLGLILIIWLIGPIFRAQYSTALGALAGTFTEGNTERVAYALGARFGMGLFGTLFTLWGASSLVLIVLSIVDPTTYRTSYPIPSETTEILGVPLIIIIAALIAVAYIMGQIVLARIFRYWAARRMIRKQKAALAAAEQAAKKWAIAASQPSGS